MTVFKFKDFSLSVSEVSSSEPLFLASDVAMCLGLHVKTISRFLKENLRAKDFRTVPSKQGRPAYYVTESGLYDLMFLAKSEIARDFRYWIVDEVLPTIRKEGAYLSPDITPEQALVVKEKVDRILDTPNPWERMYQKEACDKAFKWFGSQFYWTYCYSWMTPEEVCKLNRVNPLEPRDRKYRIHQYLEQETRDRLAPNVNRMVDFLLTSTGKQDFQIRIGRLYGNNQLGLDWDKF